MEKKITYAQALNTVLSNENIVLASDVRESWEDSMKIGDCKKSPPTL